MRRCGHLIVVIALMLAALPALAQRESSLGIEKARDGFRLQDFVRLQRRGEIQRQRTSEKQRLQDCS